jgi:WD40 repeat protein
MNEETLFHLARQKPPEQRPAFLDEACGGDAALRRRVEELLAADAEPNSFLADKPPAAAEMATLGIEGTASACDPSETRVRYFGDYELHEEIARGGMGVVYRARQVSLNRTVALKMILAGHLADAGDVQRFHTEAEAAANLDHPHIVPIYEVGQHDGQHYFSMKLIEGGNLSEQVARMVGEPRAAARLLAKVARAVHHAHQRGILHRDLKPGNILLDAHGEPHITDFGLAKSVAADRGQTRSGAIVGTPSYMSPEQARSEKSLTTATDVYSLGAILYELLTGRPPFAAATSLETVLEVLEREPQRPRALNPHADRDLETIALKCLEKDPRKRYGSAEALAVELERWLAGEPITARPASTWERTLKWAKRRPAVAALVLLGAVTAVGLPLLLTTLLQNAEARATAVKDLAAAAADLRTAQDATTQQQQLAQEAKTNLDAAQRDLVAVRSEVQRQKQQAQEAQARALRQALGLWLIGQSSGLRVNNPGLALLLAIEGRRLVPGATADNALREAIDECHEERTIATGPVSRALVLPPDGKLILALPPGQFNAGPARLWDLATGRHAGDLPLPPVAIHSAVLSPDGKLAVFTFLHYNRLRWYNKPPEVLYTDRVARVWDIAGRKEIAILKGHKSRVVSAQFSADGKQLATASWDRTARIWDTATWKETRVLEAHEGALAGALFSPDGQSLLTASSGYLHARAEDNEPGGEKKVLIDPPAGTLPPGVQPGEGPGSAGYSLASNARRVSEKAAVKIWDLATGKERTPLWRWPTGMPASLGTEDTLLLAWSPRGDQVLSWSPSFPDGLTIWDAIQGKELVSLRGREGGLIRHAGYSPDGRKVLTTHSEGTMRLWEASGGKEVLVIRAPSGLAGAPSFSPNGQWILGACADKAARIWSAQTGEELWCFRGHELGLGSAVFTPDGQRVVTASADGTVRIWSTLRGRDYARVLHTAHPVHRLAFSPDGRRLASGTQDPFRQGNERAQLWDARNGKALDTLADPGPLRRAPERDLVRDTHMGDILRLEFSSNGRRLLVASGECRARVSRTSLFGFGKTIEEDLPFTPVRIWDVETGKKVLAFEGPRGSVSGASFSPDGKFVLAAEDGRNDVRTYSNNGAQVAFSSLMLPDGQAYIWDGATGKLVQTLKGHEYGITAAAWSPDGKRVLTADFSTGSRVDGGAARIWDVASGKPVVTLEGDRGGVRLATFSPDGKHVLLLQSHASSSVEIWDAATGQVVRTLGPRPQPWRYSQERDARTGKLVTKRNGRVVDFPLGADKWPGHTSAVTHAAYSPDGRRIVTASWDKTARIWDAATGQPLYVLRGHVLALQWAAFSADGKRVVTASDDETARVWDAETGSEIITLAGHKGPVLTAVFSPDGQSVATASADNTVRIWPLDPLATALSRKPRELTAEERERFGIPSTPAPPPR